MFEAYCVPEFSHLALSCWDSIICNNWCSRWVNFLKSASLLNSCSYHNCVCFTICHLEHLRVLQKFTWYLFISICTWSKSSDLDLHLTENVCLEVKLKKFTIDSGNGLVTSGNEATAWVNNDQQLRNRPTMDFQIKGGGGIQKKTPGPRLNIKTVLSTYGDFHVKDKTAVRTSYL